MSFLTLKFRLLSIVVFAALLIIYFLSTSSYPAFSLVPLSSPAEPLLPEYKGYHSLYSFDLTSSHSPRWMTTLPSTTPLTSLSIPGTHDTMTHLIANSSYQCQNHPLTTQLDAGIRYIDIRARLVNNDLQIYHQDQYTNSSYPTVLLTLFSFLSQNPGETILMRLKEESTPINSTIDFLTAFNHYRLSSPLTCPGCEKHFYIPQTSSISPANLTLAELRNKILILQNFGPEQENAEYGIPWSSPSISLEDLWEIPDLEGLDEKFEAVKENLIKAGEGMGEGDGEGKLYLSHLSASVGVLPIEAAAGNGNGSVVGINDRIGMWLEEEKEAMGKGVGVVIVDFPGERLVREILGRNGGAGGG